jgi:hypothetical protein
VKSEAARYRKIVAGYRKIVAGFGKNVAGLEKNVAGLENKNLQKSNTNLFTFHSSLFTSFSLFTSHFSLLSGVSNFIPARERSPARAMKGECVFVTSLLSASSVFRILSGCPFLLWMRKKLLRKMELFLGNRTIFQKKVVSLSRCF